MFIVPVLVLLCLLDHWSPLRLENVYPWIIKHAWSGQLLLIWILMSFITIHLPLVGNATGDQNGTKISANVSVKKQKHTGYVKKAMSGILLHMPVIATNLWDWWTLERL